MSGNEQKPKDTTGKVQIILGLLTLIGTLGVGFLTLIGTLGGATLANWDKLFAAKSPVSSPSETILPSPPQAKPSNVEGVDKFTKEDLLGIWFDPKSSCVLSGTDWTTTWVGTSQYFRNGTYSVIGDVTYSRSWNNMNIDMTYDVNQTGEWRLDGNMVTIKLTDQRSPLKLIEIDGRQVDMTQFAARVGLNESEIQKNNDLFVDSTPNGTTHEFTVIEISGNRMRSESKTGDCPGIGDSIKQGKPFR